MALATTAAAVAGTTALAAYLDAKLHIRKDIGTLRRLKSSERDFAKASANGHGSLWYRFEDQVDTLPAETQAIWSREGAYTFAETHAQACRYAQFFLQSGIKPRELVSFYLINKPEFMFATLGAWAAGSAPALINYNLAGDALVHCLKIAGTSIVLVDEDADCRARIEEVRERIEGELGMTIKVLDSSLRAEISRLEPKRPEDELRAHVHGAYPMCLMYTSGSTGHPKACPFEVQRSGGLTGDRMRSVGLSPIVDRWYIPMPMYHGTGFTTAVSCMLSGITLVIGRKFSVSRFWVDCRDSGATAFVYVGETARYLLAAPKSPLDRQHKVRVMFGNGMRPDVWLKFVDRFGIETVAEFFNSSEGVFGLLNVSRGPFFATAVGHHGAILRLMTRNTYVPVEADHATGAIVKDPKTGFAIRKSYEEGGEILVKLPSENAFVGYYKNPEATKKKFERDVFKKGDLYYRTGDALRRTSDGRWFFLDRLGDTFRWKSENVSTAEVAECLGHFPGVVEAIVYGVEVPGHDGRAGCAALYISPELLPTFNFNALYAHCTSKLPKYAVPVFIRVLSNLNAMHNNKQNKVPLRNDGIDLRKVRERTEREAAEKGTRKEEVVVDRFYFAPQALAHPKVTMEETGYVEYTVEDFEGLKAANAKL